MSAEILTLMYHRVTTNDSPFDARLFEEHLELLITHYPIVTPGDKLDRHQLNLCLTFDDAYVDFYQFVYPILKKHKKKAILGVPTGFIVEDASKVMLSERLSVPYPHGMKGHLHKHLAPFCSFQELKEMAQSGFVELASHSHRHHKMTKLTTPDIQDEIIRSKQLLEMHCQRPVKYFIYPYGNTSPHVHHFVKKHYDYAFRIGSAMNREWDLERKMICRVNAEPFWKNQNLWQKESLWMYRWKHWLNRLRNK